MQHSREGFRHGNLIVYAVQYELASTPASWLIVWPNDRGDSLRPWVTPARANRWMAAVRPRDEIVLRGAICTRSGYVDLRGAVRTPEREIKA